MAGTDELDLVGSTVSSGVRRTNSRPRSGTPRSGQPSGRSGQGLVEFALIFPVLILVLGGIIQFGIIFWGQNTLTQVVRDAGRYAATVVDCSSTTNADIVTKTHQLAAQSSLVGTITSVTVDLPTADTTDPCPPVSNASVVWVSITAQAQVPIFFPGFPGNGSLSSQVRFRMEPQTR